ncbi:tRNA pseudouridine(55) synthase TruB [Actomonas aquatica]|uniref:tRNA pseudouridine synthase B n=1 Tax=Actomonas aquatica TaxID=2866162 RepID=A0ABZ1C879_9BACT|nr:tRNA pseudouridine(55) synthase TruB [Opitutus sp. WL0086]WRQ87799.1 tRNA pseudouridine(55) synthase TruB [Opitutus sp. WL0086]
MLGPKKEFEGVLLVDKPTDHTSHDVVARLRGKFKMKRIGHAGTLDPSATGLLVMLVGKATRVSQYMMSVEKEYTGTVVLGAVTNTQDADGEVLETRPVPELSEADILAAMKTFKGDQYQIPPMFSAIKIDGKPLYKSARKGEEVEREPRFIRVMQYDLKRWESPELDFLVRSSKGTYVRTLAHDLGQKLGCGGHLKNLRRTAAGDLNVANALPLEEILEMPLLDLEKRLLPVHEVAPRIAL